MEDKDLEELFSAASSLKSILGVDQELDEFIEETGGDIDLNVQYPYLIFDKLSLVRAMNLCNKLIQQKSDVSSYNSISLIPNIEESTVYFCATNDISHFRLSTELLGDKHEMLDMNISIPFIVLQKLVKLMGNKILIYKNGLNLYIRLIDGDLLLDIRQPNMDIVKFPGNVDTSNKLAELDILTFGYISNSFLPLLNSEMRSEAKRVYFNGDIAYFISGTYYMEAKIKTPQLVLSLKDIEFFSKLYKYYKDKKIILFGVKDSAVPRVFVKMDNREYQFINSKVPNDPLITQQLDKLSVEPECTVNYERLTKIISLSNSLPTSTGNVKLSYKNDKLNICITSNKGDSNFNLSTTKLSTKLYTDEVLVNSSVLRTLLYVFNLSNSINISITDLTLVLSSGAVKVILMHNN